MAVPALAQSRTRKRLSKSARRDQLLQTARQLLEADGAEQLTLASVAEKAGVSKPVAYDHFSTRAGLLLALLEDTNRFFEADAAAKIEAAPQTLPAIAEIVADAYVNCSVEAGPAVAILSAAIAADSTTREAGIGFQSGHANQFRRAFDPVLFPNAASTLLFKSLVAAANAICEELTRGVVSEADAKSTLSALLITSLTPHALPTSLERISE